MAFGTFCFVTDFAIAKSAPISYAERRTSHKLKTLAAILPQFIGVKSLKEIIGKSILLRKYCIDDAEFIFNWRNDKKTTIYMGKKFRDQATMDQVKSSLSNVINLKNKDSLFYAIADKDTKEYIGGIDLTSIDPIDKTCVMSIVIGKEKFRNKGIASEAIGLLMDIAFMDLKLHKIELNVYEKNIPALKCYQKNGFIIEGTSRDHMIIDGQYENLIHMGILESEYFQGRN